MASFPSIRIEGGLLGPDVLDPQAQVAGQTLPGPTGKPPRTLHIVQVDRLPTENWGNTRWGARLTGVIDRTYSVNDLDVPFGRFRSGPE